MNYTLHQLQVFLKVSEKQSITKAAEELFLTQPAVSIQLKNFQDQFSIPLTEVVGRQLFVTDFGKEIAVAAQKIIDEVAAINYKTLAYEGMLSGRLKISVVSTGKYVMPYFLSSFMHNNKGIDLNMDVTNKAKVVKSLEKNEVDFALVSVLPTHLKIERVALMENKLFFVGGTKRKIDSRLSRRKMFETLPLIYREQGSATRNAMERFISGHGFPVRKKIELTSNEAVKQAVIAGLGYSIMPLIGIKNDLKNKDLQIIRMQGLPISTTWNLIWLSSKKHSPVATAFLEYIKGEKEKIIQEHFNWFQDIG
ncbi:LysR family transcriptional regulator [Flavobacteriaceae bacterium TP-CH-4]|uniref:LysR family transcriptional regulator n=1 Tax=Pelagihabitans pacificus TaxID=2696054 RepID=A0A967ECW1_9FLAO|nr:LysR family transcriptional regulator [Pelagihabitans pacificus]NHF58698.1 LysR family transcriptional regulator [Pelagihabitans pacificus]